VQPSVPVHSLTVLALTLLAASLGASQVSGAVPESSKALLLAQIPVSRPPRPRATDDLVKLPGTRAMDEPVSNPARAKSIEGIKMAQPVTTSQASASRADRAPRANSAAGTRSMSGSGQLTTSPYRDTPEFEEEQAETERTEKRLREIIENICRGC
jgi:hypothetical protein